MNNDKMNNDDIFEMFDDILEKKQSLVAWALRNKSVLKDFVNMLTKDFIKLLGNNYSVVKMFNSDVQTGKTSYYFYVFDNRIIKVKMDEGKVGSVLHLATNILGGVNDSEEKNERDLKRLLGLKKKGIVNLSFDEQGKLIDIKLNGCVLLIRASGHNPPEDDNLMDLRAARRNIVEHVHYYNIEEIGEYFNITVDKVEYAKFKAGKDRILYEFRKKLEDAGIENSIIMMVLTKVDNIFLKHKM